MVRFRPRYLWFYFSLALGSLLGLLLLAQSVITYYQVSRFMIQAELRREAQRHVSALEREARRVGAFEPFELLAVLRELREEAPQRIAWIRVIDAAGRTVVQEGEPVGEPFSAERLWAAFELATPVSEVRHTPKGSVLVTVLPLRLPRRPPPEAATGAQRPRQARAQEAPGAGPAPSSPVPRTKGPRPGPRFVEVGLYVAGGRANFGRLLTNLVVNSSAALGLVASMIVLWLRFPDYVRGKQLEQQTELARRVQRDLLPAPDVELDALEFSAGCTPAWQVGGDFYDVYVDESGRIGLALGDVSGKGLPASVMAGLLLGAVRFSSWVTGPADHEAATERLNELLRTRTAPERFASLFWCYYEPGTGELRYINAGHVPPLIVRRKPDGARAVEVLEDGGPLLGVLKEARYRQGSVRLAPGDLLVIYSDGVVEAQDASGNDFGRERLQATILANAERSCAEIRDAILRSVEAFMGRSEAQDDLTLAVARVRA
ncbi:MAG: PP2C family protein-serine/threonine phosphatase [Bryobacterales bacterium]|nr:PP2C family protein-serine/threonine phosphatase [Bryobacteraceae bacterium]MDW8128992.1 PP2C family protein-serine/threonine phosphatase [Bryobacterales bacterium]